MESLRFTTARLTLPLLARSRTRTKARGASSRFGCGVARACFTSHRIRGDCSNVSMPGRCVSSCHPSQVEAQAIFIASASDPNLCGGKGSRTQLQRAVPCAGQSDLYVQLGHSHERLKLVRWHGAPGVSLTPSWQYGILLQSTLSRLSG